MSKCCISSYDRISGDRLIYVLFRRPVWEALPMKNGKGAAGLMREERLQIMLSPEELRAVDTFRFVHRMPSRAAAVRELLRHGLGAVAENGGVKSGDYGVLKAPKGVGPSRFLQRSQAARHKRAAARIGRAMSARHRLPPT